jgi:hypothetical protein
MQTPDPLTTPPTAVPIQQKTEVASLVFRVLLLATAILGTLYVSNIYRIDPEKFQVLFASSVAGGLFLLTAPRTRQ